MNLGDIKPLSGDKPQGSKVDSDLKARLQEEGLKQAARFQESQVSLSTSQSKTEIGVRVLTASFNQTVVIGQSRPTFDAAPKKKDSTFDFEEVAKNVLNFVGGVIRAAKQGGADDEKLNGLFEQATSGVLKGIELARKDLAGFLNGEIEDGIQKSHQLIQDGINQLRQEIFGEPVESKDAVAVDTSVSYSRAEAGNIEIVTKDGDKVTIGFEDVRHFELNQQLLASTQIPPREPAPKAEAEEDKADNTLSASTDRQSEKSEESPVEENAPATESQYKESLNYFERSGLTFSLEGDLDEDEFKAIADLVGDVKDLAQSFFKNDIEGAFNKALDLGFDEQELAGYSLQLSKTEQVQVIQTYGTVSHFNESQENQGRVDPVKQVRPIADYLKDVIAVAEKSRELLQDDQQYENLVSGLLNKVLDLNTNELVDAIHQFNSFNNRLLRDVPDSAKEEIAKE